MATISLAYYGRYNYNSDTNYATNCSYDEANGRVQLGYVDLDAVNNYAAVNGLGAFNAIIFTQGNGANGVVLAIVSLYSGNSNEKTYTVTEIATWGTFTVDEEVAVVAILSEVPAQYNVRNNVTYGSFTGNLTLPGVGDVRENVTFGGNSGEQVGTFEVPLNSTVSSGIQYGAGGTEFTGALAAPAQYNVRDGVSYGIDDTQYTGNLTLPSANQVEGAVAFGGNGGTEYLGSLNSSISGPRVIPAGWLGQFTVGSEIRFTFAIVDGFGALQSVPSEIPLQVWPEMDVAQGTSSGMTIYGNSMAPVVVIDTSNTTIYTPGKIFSVVINGPYTVAGVSLSYSTLATFQIVTSEGGGGGGGGSISMVGELLGSVRVVGPANTSLGNVSGLSAFDGSLIIGTSEGGTSRFAIGATVANTTFGQPITDGASVIVTSGPNAANNYAVSLSVPNGVTLWLLSYKQPRVNNEF